MLLGNLIGSCYCGTSWVEVSSKPFSRMNLVFKKTPVLSYLKRKGVYSYILVKLDARKF